MKKLLNTLFVTTQGAYLAKEGETVAVRVGQETKLHLPIHTLGGIVCFGQVSMTPALMGMCAEHGVGVSFLTENGRFLARVQGAVSGNVLLRREQYRRADNQEASVALSRSFLLGKIINSRTVLNRALRDHEDKIDANEVRSAAGRLQSIAKQMAEAGDLDEIRGYEGEAANHYFGVFDQMIVNQKESFYFRGRNRRPPLDNVNCLLSFLYTLTMHDVRSALEGVGLDPAVGFLHRDRPGRPSLALDLMEELRSFFADRLALTLINLGQVQDKGFRRTESGAVLMSDETRKSVLVAYQKRKQEEIMHPFLEEKIEIGLLFHAQALLLARYLRGDMNGYPPFFWR